MRCCGVHAKLAEQLDGSTFSFLCADLCRQPCLYLFGLLVAAVQSLLLLLVWARAEANMFYELYSYGLVNATTMSLDASLMFPSENMWAQLGRTAAPGEGIAAAGFAGGASFAPPANDTAGLERYKTMIMWSEHHPYLPTQITHPDLQLDYALLFSLLMIIVWASKDAITAVLALCSGNFVVAALMATNVGLALLTGWDQMYVKFLPIFVWDVPANVIGVSPISMILDSVAVMLILDLDEKAYGFVRGLARRPVTRLQAKLAAIENQSDDGRFVDVLDEEALV